MPRAHAAVLASRTDGVAVRDADGSVVQNVAMHLHCGETAAACDESEHRAVGDAVHVHDAHFTQLPTAVRQAAQHSGQGVTTDPPTANAGHSRVRQIANAGVCDLGAAIQHNLLQVRRQLYETRAQRRATTR